VDDPIADQLIERARAWAAEDPDPETRAELERLLAALPDADEVTVEANPETVTPALARLLSRNRVNRVSVGAQSFQPHLLEVLERRATPETVRRAVYLLRDASFDNISLDLVYGIPGQPQPLRATAQEFSRDGDAWMRLPYEQPKPSRPNIITSPFACIGVGFRLKRCST
jgi:histone acetyltransferase (RNA polymerase elongator complex component)